MELKWDEEHGVDISVERRDEWARQVAAGAHWYVASGNRIVFSVRDGEELEIMDAVITRSARIQAPDDGSEEVAVYHLSAPPLSSEGEVSE